MPALPRRPVTDLCDDFPDRVRVAEPLFLDFGARAAFSGAISTLRIFEENVLLRAALEEPGQGRVLVVDGGGSKRCAVLGGNLAALGAKNGWDGALIFGCVRDSAELGATDFGVKALAAHPMKSGKRSAGERDVAVTFAGLTFAPGQWLYADRDGVIVADEALS